MKALVRLAFWMIVLAIVFQAVTHDPQGARATVGDVGRALTGFVSWITHR